MRMRQDNKKIKYDVEYMHIELFYIYNYAEQVVL